MKISIGDHEEHHKNKKYPYHDEMQKPVAKIIAIGFFFMYSRNRKGDEIDNL